ncbi:MAG: 4-hydroxy-tetrahydrodipicolinate synthase [Bacteroidales bacterium]|nr:4-hydroxy-tetrahydrodipicolinate synthase [Bacteroidales bacterium]
MLNVSKFKGTGVAIVTPFNNDGSVDFKSFEKVIEHIIAGKCEYLVVLGTTGESPVISKEEKREITKFAIEKINGRVPVVLGIGGNYTKEVADTINKNEFKVDAILSVCPYYNKPQQQGIFEHYKTIANASPYPIMMYNVPGRSGVNIKSETTLKIANEIEKVIAVKEASGDLYQMAQVIKNKPKDFLVISGDDSLTLPLMSIGGDGIISVIANAYPKLFSDMVRFCMNDNFAEARKIHLKLTDMMNALFADGSPGGIKAALSIKGFCQNNLRLPLVKANEQTFELIKKLDKEI